MYGGLREDFSPDIDFGPTPTQNAKLQDKMKLDVLSLILLEMSCLHEMVQSWSDLSLK